MIIQIRGTSGSGKTWVMKEFMKDYSWIPQYEKGRKQPLLYKTYLNKTSYLTVLGHYESPCGGCDTIGSARQVFELIDTLPTGDVIVCEGLLLSEDVKWVSQVDNVKILYLNTEVEKCISQIRDRRKAAGNDKPLKEHNTRNRVGVIERSRVRLIDLGVSCRRCSVQQAPKLIRRLINARRTRLDR